jgi:hypothetical protein
MKRFLIFGIALLFVLTACEQPQDGGGTGALGSPGKGGNPGTETTLFTITGSGTGPLKRGGSRQFVVNPKYNVIWTVEGADPVGGTAITLTETKRGRLTVGKDETNRTLTVKATSVENPEAFRTVSVAVDGVPAVWTELTAGLKGYITYRTNGYYWFGVGVDDASFGIHVLAYGEGAGPGKGRWVLGGGSDFRNGLEDTGNGYHFWPVMVYSDDDGDTWTEIHTTPALLYQENTLCLIYDGPPDDRKFILGTGRGNVFWSYDGVNWTKVTDIFPDYTPENGLKYVYQVLYADIDANGGRGRYLAVGTRGRFTWSDDGKKWEQHYTTAEERYVYESPLPGVFPGADGFFVRYGTGIINGSRVKMFFMEGTNHQIEGNAIHSYSLDGIEWVILDEDKVAALDFKPTATPGGANSQISWKDEADTSAILFATEEIEPYTVWGKTDTLVEHEGVNKHVNFVGYGNGKYLAVGLGRRLARTDAETAKKK